MADDIERPINCATGGACAAGRGADAASIRRLAQWALGEGEFWHNAWGLTRVSTELNGVVPLALSRNVRSQRDAWYHMSELGWEYLGDVAKVSESYFKESLYSSIFGSHTIGLVSDAGMVGAK